MKVWKMIIVCALGFSAMNARSDGEPVEWMPNKSMQQKLEALSELRPNTSLLMLQMGERYKNLYWAARQGKWDFANYQAEEMLEILNILILSQPRRAATASDFVSAVFPMLPKAIAKHDIKTFESAFEKMRTQCMACHGKNDHAFITLPIPKSANSPVLNM